MTAKKNTTAAASKKNKAGKSLHDKKGQPVSAVAKRYEETNFVDTSLLVWNYSLLTDEDVRNYQDGTNYQLYKKFGSHSIEVNNTWGMYFCVWAPNATAVSV